MSQPRRQDEDAADAPSPAAVEAYLRANPAFLAERPELFRALVPPRRVHGERLADHMAAMLAAERRRLRGLEGEMAAALAAGRADQGLAQRVRLAVLALMRGADPAEVVAQEWPALLGLESCALAAEHPDRRGLLPLPAGLAARLLPPGREAAVRAAPTLLEVLHPEAAALVTRDALVRVPVARPMLLVLGARQPAALPVRHVTGTLGFLGRAVAVALAR